MTTRRTPRQPDPPMVVWANGRLNARRAIQETRKAKACIEAESSIRAQYRRADGSLDVAMYVTWLGLVDVPACNCLRCKYEQE